MNESQKQAIAALVELWNMEPEIRLGQLMAHLGFLGECHLEQCLGNIEDDELIAIMYRHRAELLARLEDSPNQTLPTSEAPVSVSGGAMSPRPSLSLAGQNAGTDS